MQNRFVSLAAFAVVSIFASGPAAHAAQDAPVGGCEFLFAGQPSGSCVDYFSGAPAALQSFCAANGHTYHKGGCPKALRGGARVGSCTLAKSAGQAPQGYTGPVAIRYYPPFSAATQQGMCANNQGGAWTAK